MALDPAVIDDFNSQVEGFKQQLVLLLNARLPKTSAASDTNRFNNLTYEEFMEVVGLMIDGGIEEYDTGTIAQIREAVTNINMALGSRPQRTTGEVITGNWTMHGLRVPMLALTANGATTNVSLANGPGLVVVDAATNPTMVFTNLPAMVNATATSLKVRINATAPLTAIVFNNSMKMSNADQPWPEEYAVGLHEFEATISRTGGVTTITVRYLGSQI